MAFGQTLSNLRRRKGLTQEQLAEELNLTRQTISKWELNQSLPDIEYILKLSEFFQVSTDYLIKGKESDFKKDFSTLNNSITEPKNNNNATWYFWSGIVLAAISLIGIVAFVICASLNPWGAVVNNWYFDGLLGFLIGTKSLRFFIILTTLLISGITFSVCGILKKKSK